MPLGLAAPDACVHDRLSQAKRLNRRSPGSRKPLPSRARWTLTGRRPVRPRRGG